MDVKPIRTNEDYEAALSRIEKLFDAPVGTPGYDELDILTTLVEAYEDKNHPVPAPTPIEAIKFRMEQEGLERKDVEHMVGLSRARLSEVLSKRRALSIGMIRKFSEQLHISADVLVREYPLKRPRLSERSAARVPKKKARR